MKKFVLATAILIIPGILFVQEAFAILGVGIGTGTITVDEDLHNGMTYNLPSITILNTGDEEAVYSIDIAYHQDQKELLPPANWFKFTPTDFALAPGESKVVNIQLSLPMKDTIPGDYFCYVEGHPKQTSKAGETTVGVAAASKLYFTVAPSNLIEGIYYKTIAVWNAYYPWSLVVSISVLAILLIVLFRKFFKISLTVNKKDN